jgi:hypothetical protein
MAESRITLGEWLPDQPGLAGALTEAKNVIPVGVGYAPFTSEVNLSQNASQNILTVFAGKFAGATTLFGAGATKIFKFDSTDTSMDDVSRTASAYTSTDRWSYTQFGKVIIAANGLNALQGWTLNTSTNFADLSASAPSASFVTVVRDFVVAGKTAANAHRVLWSDINDETDWVSGPTSQSDYQDIPDGGDIQGVRGGEFGLVFLERAIVRMSYIGAPLFFQFDSISRNLGCYESRSIVQFGPTSYFLADDGFYACDGQNIIPIGAEKVDRFFFADANPSLINQMSSAVDPINSLVIWCYANTFGSKSLLIYSWQRNGRTQLQAQIMSLRLLVPQLRLRAWTHTAQWIA